MNTLSIFWRNLSVFPVAGGVAESKKDTSGRPGEFVSQRIIGCFRSWKTTAIGHKGKNLSSLGMDIINCLDSVQVIDSRIQTNLIHNHNSSFLNPDCQLQAGRTYSGSRAWIASET